MYVYLTHSNLTLLVFRIFPFLPNTPTCRVHRVAYFVHFIKWQTRRGDVASFQL